MFELISNKIFPGNKFPSRENAGVAADRGKLL